MAINLPEPPAKMKSRVVKEEVVKRIIGFNLESAARKMVFVHRLRWPKGSYNPRPVVVRNGFDETVRKEAIANDLAAEAMLPELIEAHPGFEEAD